MLNCVDEIKSESKHMDKIEEIVRESISKSEITQNKLNNKNSKDQNDTKYLDP